MPAAPEGAGHGPRLPLTLIVAPTPRLTPPGRLHEADAQLLTRRVRWFVGATISWNVLEAAIALSSGVRASSSALMGFGLDSVVEVSSAVVLAWQFTAKDAKVRQAREQRALRLIACCFFALALFVGVDAARGLLTGEVPAHSNVGLVLAGLSVVVMPFLSWGQRRTGRALESASAVADSAQTMLCTYLSAVLLVGLGMNSAFGWWWADGVAALVIAGLAAREGVSAWRGEACCVVPVDGEREDDVAGAPCECGDACCA